MLLPEVHRPAVDAYGKVHVVVQLADDVGVLGVGVRGEEPRVGGHAHAGQELVHRIRRLKNARKSLQHLHLQFHGGPDWIWT